MPRNAEALIVAQQFPASTAFHDIGREEVLTNQHWADIFPSNSRSGQLDSGDDKEDSAAPALRPAPAQRGFGQLQHNYAAPAPDRIAMMMESVTVSIGCKKQQGFHIGDHIDFLQNCHQFWWFPWIFANFGDFFIEIFSDSLKCSLFLVNDFSLILMIFLLGKPSPILVTFFTENFIDSLKFSLFLVNDFSPILVTFPVSKLSPILVIFFIEMLLIH